MKVTKASYEIIDHLDGDKILKKIELCGRICYKSEEKITDESAEKFVRTIIKHGHESVLEHVSFSVRFIVDRGVSHEIVRHRIASFSQESTRYCNYGHNNEIEVIEPIFWRNPSPLYEDVSCLSYGIWQESCEEAERVYLDLINSGLSCPQEARSVLPNSLKTELIMTANLREWRHFLKLRTSKAAHPQIREVTIPLLSELQKIIPIVFDDIIVEG